MSIVIKRGIEEVEILPKESVDKAYDELGGQSAVQAMLSDESKMQIIFNILTTII